MLNNYYNRLGESYNDDLNYIQMLRPNRIGYNHNLNNYYARYMDRPNMQNRFYQNEYQNFNGNPYSDYTRVNDEFLASDNYNAANMYNNHYNGLDYTLFYPAIYRIINPVVKKVLYSSNIDRLDENLVNNLTDTVFNIVDGDLPKESVGSENINVQESINQNNQAKVINTNSKPNDYSQKMTGNNNIDFDKRNNFRDTLVKDLIKILIINEYRLMYENIAY